ncbi:MAG TPA: AAA family ATPase, partial [Roseiflexaceae bacterium]|nr:AAA family ATPase [Roseiflexaceae bacterium]
MIRTALSAAPSRATITTMRHTPHEADRPLAGRRRERERLVAQLDRATSGELRVCLLAGEPGIGKTRLLRSLAREAAGRGMPALAGGASEAEGMPPFLPFLEALGGYVSTADPAALTEQAGSGAAALAAVLPELAARLGPLPAGPSLPPEQARLRLFQAVARLLTAAAEPRGLLLLLDDLQWADPASLDLLCHLARDRPAVRVLVLGAYRAGEAAGSPLLRALAELSRLRALETIELGPLSEDGVAALAAAVLGAPPDPALARELWLQSEGNPFFAEELLRDWAERGVAARAGDRWAL